MPDAWEDKKRSHKDTGARWTKKGGESHYGYKNHAKVARKTKLIAGFEVTDASVHDSQTFEGLPDPATDSGAWGDSAFQSKGAAAMLKAKGHPQPRAREGLQEPPADRRSEGAQHGEKQGPRPGQTRVRVHGHHGGEPPRDDRYREGEARDRDSKPSLQPVPI